MATITPQQQAQYTQAFNNKAAELGSSISITNKGFVAGPSPMQGTYTGGQSMPAMGTAEYNQIAQNVNQPMNASDLNNNANVMLPSRPQPQNPGNLVAQMNGALANGQFGLSTGKDGQLIYTPPPVQAETADSIENRRMQNMMAKLGLQGPPPSQEEIYRSLPERNMVENARRDVQNYAGQINTISAQAQADTLAVTGQGRGIPEVIIGGQQAQINKEAAIKALPIQALLANAQGNLEMAQQQLDIVFKLKSQDAISKYDYKNKVIDAVYEVADKSDQRKLDDLKLKENRAYAENQDFLKLQRDLLGKAVSQGAPSSVVSAINSAKDSNEAIKSAGKYTGDILDRENKMLNNQKLRADVAKTNAEAALIANRSGGDSDDLKAYANQHADTGNLPSESQLKASGLSVGQITKLSKQIPRPNGSIVSTNTGVKPSSTVLSSTQEDGIIAAIDADKKLARLQELYNSDGISIPFSKERVEFKAIRDEFVDLLARSRTGAVINDEESERYEAKIPSITLSSKPIGNIQFDTLRDTLSGKLDITLKSQGVSVYGYSKVKVGDTERTVGEILDMGGVQYRVLPDGTLTDII